jgi:hypothetical protein
MDRQKSLLNKLLKCHCGSNFRFIKQRSKKCYVCSAYNNYKSHERNLIEENLIISFIKRYCQNEKIEYQENNQFMSSVINQINIDKNGDITINYQDGYQQIISDNFIQY